jgi:hypothetical protein
MKRELLLCGGLLCGCTSPSRATSELDGAVQIGSDAANGEAGASDAAAPSKGDGGVDTLVCAASLSAACCGGSAPCVATWSSEIECSATGGIPEIVPDCGGFHATRDISDVGTYWLYDATTQQLVGALFWAGQGGLGSVFSCSYGPPTIAVPVACESFWSTYPLFSSGLSCVDGGGAPKEFVSCDAGASSDAAGD